MLTLYLRLYIGTHAQKHTHTHSSVMYAAFADTPVGTIPPMYAAFADTPVGTIPPTITANVMVHMAG